MGYILLNVNYEKNELLIEGNENDFNILANYLLELNENKTMELKDCNDPVYTIPIKTIEFIISCNRNLLLFYMKENTLYIEGNKNVFKKLATGTIEPISDADENYHIDLFYYDGNDLLDVSDIFITFVKIME